MSERIAALEKQLQQVKQRYNAEQTCLIMAVDRLLMLHETYGHGSKYHSACECVMCRATKALYDARGRCGIANGKVGEF